VVCYLVEPTGTLGRAFHARAADLSAAGAALEIAEPIKLTGRICIRIRASAPFLDVIVVGRVLRSSKWPELACGVRFEGLEIDTKRALTRFVFAEAKRQDLGSAIVERPTLALRDGPGRPLRVPDLEGEGSQSAPHEPAAASASQPRRSSGFYTRG